MRVNIKISVNNKSLHSIVVLAMLIVGCMCLVNAQQKEPQLVLEKKITSNFPGNDPGVAIYITDDEYILYKTSEKFYIYGGEIEFYDKKWRLKSKMKIEPWRTVRAISENGKFIGESRTVSYGRAAFEEIFTLKDKKGNVIWEKKIRHKDVVISNDGSVVMTRCSGECFQGRDLYFFDKGGNLVKKVNMPRAGFRTISKDGKIIIAGGRLSSGERGLHIFDNNGNYLFRYHGGNFIKFSKNDKYLIFQNRDGSISYYDRNGNIVKEIELDDDEIYFVEKDDKNKKFKIFNLKKGKVVKEIDWKELIPELPKGIYSKVLNDRKTILIYHEKKNVWVLKLK